jgi:hypothetical protein
LACNQIKVPEMSVAAVRAGPPSMTSKVFGSRTRNRNLVAQLAVRRTPSKMR